MKRILYTLLLLVLMQPLSAQTPQVKVLALFTGKALLQIDGDRKLMKKGETFRGVTLLSASARGAQVRLPQGQQMELGVKQHISSAYKKSRKDRHTIYANSAGMFVVDGQINGRGTRFLLDTGATFVAMSEQEADRLGLAYESGSKSLVQTASEVVPVWNIKLDSVKVGGISIPQVDAVVLNGDQPGTVLLGMSFLQHLTLQRNGSAMVLEQKYQQ